MALAVDDRRSKSKSKEPTYYMRLLSLTLLDEFLYEVFLNLHLKLRFSTVLLFFGSGICSEVSKFECLIRRTNTLDLP